MSTINNHPYSSPRNINLKGSASGGSIIRFNNTNSSNPLDSSSNGLYADSDNNLKFSKQGTAGITLTGKFAKSIQTTAPTVSTLNGFLSTSVVSIVSGSTDVAGTITTTVGTYGTLVLSFNSVYKNAPIVVICGASPSSVGGDAARMYVSSSTTGSCVIEIQGTTAGANINYICIEASAS